MFFLVIRTLSYVVKISFGMSLMPNNVFEAVFYFRGRVNACVNHSPHVINEHMFVIDWRDDITEHPIVTLPFDLIDKVAVLLTPDLIGDLTAYKERRGIGAAPSNHVFLFNFGMVRKSLDAAMALPEIR